jgi:hypothetical protein
MKLAGFEIRFSARRAALPPALPIAVDVAVLTSDDYGPPKGTVGVVENISADGQYLFIAWVRPGGGGRAEPVLCSDVMALGFATISQGEPIMGGSMKTFGQVVTDLVEVGDGLDKNLAGTPVIEWDPHLIAGQLRDWREARDAVTRALTGGSTNPYFFGGHND